MPNHHRLEAQARQLTSREKSIEETVPGHLPPQHRQFAYPFTPQCAWELIKTIRRQDFGQGRVFINTADLQTVSKEGVRFFKAHMKHKQLPTDWIYFKGQKGFELAPDHCRIIVPKKLYPKKTNEKTAFQPQLRLLAN